MPRKRLLIRPRKLTIHLPGDVAERLEQFLFSSTVGKVPAGAYQDFFTARIEEFFGRAKVEGETMLNEIEKGEPQ